MLSGDAGKVRQVLINLLSNAVKFTSRGRVAVRAVIPRGCSATGTSSRSPSRDTGPGIEPQNLVRIFDAFDQADSNGRHRRHGTGPGHQPELRAPDARRPRRREHAGNRERVHVLVRSRPSRRSMPSRNARRDPIPTGLGPNQPAVKVLDRGRRGDQPRSARRAVVADWVSSRARQRAARKPSRCTTSGIPIWCSWTCACRVSADWKPSGDCGECGSTAAIIAVTASGLAGTEDEARDAGVDAFVRKPYREGELLAVIGERLGVRYVYGSPVRGRRSHGPRRRRRSTLSQRSEQPAARR